MRLNPEHPRRVAGCGSTPSIPGVLPGMRLNPEHPGSPSRDAAQPRASRESFAGCGSTPSIPGVLPGMRLDYAHPQPAPQLAPAICFFAAPAAIFAFAKAIAAAPVEPPFAFFSTSAVVASISTILWSISLSVMPR